MQKRILILGGGFAGVKVAQRLSRLGSEAELEITLVDPKSYMEYHAACYRMATGRSPMEVCLPYRRLLSEKRVNVVRDVAVKIQAKEKIVLGISGSVYHYDVLILALGAVPNFFGIPGIEDVAMTFQSACSCIALRQRLESGSSVPRSVIIVGGGATGVELAGEIAARNGERRAMPSVEIVEARTSILSGLLPQAQEKVLQRLSTLNVSVSTGTHVTGAGAGFLETDRGRKSAEIIIWTAGVKPHNLLKDLSARTDPSGRLIVGPTLEVQGLSDVYALGDCASTAYPGMAQTAVQHAYHVARVISARHRGIAAPILTLREPAHAVPVGQRWAVFSYRGLFCSGKTAWILRRLLDLIVFLIYLAPLDAVFAFRSIRFSEKETTTCPLK